MSDAVPIAAHPLLRAWITPGDALPDLAEIGQRLASAEAFDGVKRPVLRAQTRQLQGDGLHYESRIAERKELATRENSAHDNFNALAWLRHPELKWALNARQVADIAKVGPKQRTRGQCALTHFDEAGAIVWLADETLLSAWDAHDWPALFDAHAGWGERIAVTVFGHALLEHVWKGISEKSEIPTGHGRPVRDPARAEGIGAAGSGQVSDSATPKTAGTALFRTTENPHWLPVAKTLVVAVHADVLRARADAHAQVHWRAGEAPVAKAIRDGRLLADPQELRPLPLAGIPGWHPRRMLTDFFQTEPCFRPLRPGRRYPGTFRDSCGIFRDASGCAPRVRTEHAPQSGKLL